MLKLWQKLHEKEIVGNFLGILFFVVFKHHAYQVRAISLLCTSIMYFHSIDETSDVSKSVSNRVP